jgi:hypothetical protein
MSERREFARMARGIVGGENSLGGGTTWGKQDFEASAHGEESRKTGLSPLASADTERAAFERPSLSFPRTGQRPSGKGNCHRGRHRAACPGFFCRPRHRRCFTLAQAQSVDDGPVGAVQLAQRAEMIEATAWVEPRRPAATSSSALAISRASGDIASPKAEGVFTSSPRERERERLACSGFRTPGAARR